MKKVVYISPESFIDVDIPVIKELNKIYDILWIVTFVKDIKDTTRFFSPLFISDYCSEYKVRYLIVEDKRRARNPFRIFSAFKKIIGPIKKFKPDIIYFESFYDPYLPFVARFCLGISKTIIGLHDVEYHSGNGIIHKILHRFTIRIFKYFHVFSQTQRILFAQKFPNKKVKVARLFLKDFGKKVEIEKSSEATIFLFFGRIYSYKGLDILLKAISMIPSDLNKRFKVIIAGKCNGFEYYENLILDKSVFDLRLRFIKNEEVPELFCKADFLILPYRDVTQSGPLFTAFNYNLPSITSDLPGFEEYIEDGVNGYIFENGNPLGLSKCLKAIIEMDNDSRLKIKSNLADFVKREFAIDKTVKEYKLMLDQVL